MHNEEKRLPGHVEKKPEVSKKPKATIEKNKLAKRTAEAKSTLYSVEQELGKEIDALNEKANNYGRFQFSGGLKDFVVNEATLELILSDDKKNAVAKAKEEAADKVGNIKIKIKAIKQQITALETVVKNKAGEDKKLLENKLEEVKINLEETAKILEAAEEYAQLLSQLSAKLDDKSAQENWLLLSRDSDLLKVKSEKIKELKGKKEAAEVEYNTLHSVNSIITILDELIDPFRDAVINPYEFSVSSIVNNNLKGRNLETLGAFTKGRVLLGVVSDILTDPNIKLKDMGRTVADNIKEVINLAANAPNLINKELKSQGKNPEGINDLLQSNFVSSMLRSPAIFELLLNHSDNLGQIIWNFQNDLAPIVRNIIDTPSELTTASQVKVVDSLLSSPTQIESLVEIVKGNVPIFQEMLSNNNSAFNKLMKEYGISNPEAIADLIPSLITVVSALPPHHPSVQEIFKELSPIIASDQPIDLPAFSLPSVTNPDKTKFHMVLTAASTILFGAEGKPGLAGSLHEMLSQNTDKVTKALFEVPALNILFKRYNITPEVVEPRIKVIANLINKENLPHFKALLEAASNIKFDKDGSPVLEIADIIGLANIAAPIFKDKEFRDAFRTLFEKENIDPIQPVISTVLSLIFGEKLPPDLVSLTRDENFTLMGKIVDHTFDKVPDILSKINSCREQLAKIERLANIQAQLGNSDLTADERIALLAKARNDQLTSGDIRILMSMGLNLLTTSGISTLLKDNHSQIAEFGNNSFLQSLIKPFLPKQLRNSNVLLPQAISFVLPAASFITNERMVGGLNKVIPEKIEIILNQLGEEKPSFAQIYEAISDIGEAFSAVLNDKELAALYREQFIPMIKGSRREVKAFIDEILRASPDARKFHIDSEAVLRFLEDEKSLTKFSSAFNDMLQKDFASRIKGTFKATELVITSSDARIIIWQLLIDTMVSYFRENIVPSFVKKWAAGLEVNTVISMPRKVEDGKVDLSDVCKNYYTSLGKTSLARYFIKTQNFSAQVIYSDLANMVIDSFDFKDASFTSQVIDLSNTEISNSNLNLSLKVGQKIDLTGAIIDIKTLESMVTLFNKGQVNYPTTLKLSEPPVSKEAQRVLNLITNPEIRQHLETHYVIQPTKFAEKAIRDKGVIQQGRST
jgi:hypothetical protein